jgi:hypothetical protein
MCTVSPLECQYTIDKLRHPLVREHNLLGAQSLHAVVVHGESERSETR